MSKTKKRYRQIRRNRGGVESQAGNEFGDFELQGQKRNCDEVNAMTVGPRKEKVTWARIEEYDEETDTWKPIYGKM
jgi:hypothetical protein